MPPVLACSSGRRHTPECARNVPRLTERSASRRWTARTTMCIRSSSTHRGPGVRAREIAQGRIRPLAGPASSGYPQTILQGSAVAPKRLRRRLRRCAHRHRAPAHRAAESTRLGGCGGIEPPRRRAVHLRRKCRSFPLVPVRPYLARRLLRGFETLVTHRGRLARCVADRALCALEGRRQPVPARRPPRVGSVKKLRFLRQVPSA